MKPQSASKKSYIQITEARYSRMDDAIFVKTFEEEREEEIREDYTLLRPKHLPFFEANLTKPQFADLYDDFAAECAYIHENLDRYPHLISKLPLCELWRMVSWERMMLLVEHPEEAEILRQTLEGDDIWAYCLPMFNVQIQRSAAKVCPWETLIDSQKRYMSLKSTTLKRIIEKL